MGTPQANAAKEESHRNNIGAIRLLLAGLVVYCHCYLVGLGKDAPDPLAVLTGGQESFGSLAVNLFFLLSGYLITKSWQESESAAAFLRKRILRIYPGYLVALFFSAGVAAAFAYPHALHYLGRLCRYNDQLLRSAVYFADPSVLDSLDTFRGNPYPGAVNHCLWTLQPEVVCYLAVAGVGALGVLGRPRTVALGFAVLQLGYAVNLLAGEVAREVYHLELGEAAYWRLFTHFACGAAYYRYRVPLRSPALMAGATATLALGAICKPLLAAAMPLAGGYLLFSLAFAPRAPLHRLFARVDLSYGVYVYAWPVQQACVTVTGIREPVAIFGASLPIIAALSWLSWTFIERPCLRWKKPDRSPRSV